jgi:acyl transferase domain-containing protein
MHADSVAFDRYLALLDQDGLPPDPILRFHVCHGATIVGAVPGYRPADSTNGGYGVLVEYDVRRERASATASLSSFDSQILAEAARHILGPSRCEAYAQGRAWVEMGFDSLDLFSLRATLRARTGVEVDPTSFFRHSTPRALVESFTLNASTGDLLASPSNLGAELSTSAAGAGFHLSIAPAQGVGDKFATRSEEVPAHSEEPSSDRNSRDIAIVGAACRFPGGADTPERYWEILNDRRSPITEIPPQRWTSRPTALGARFGGFLDDVAGFDASFFHLAPTEAAEVDPQQRLLLEASWEALERAGIAPDSLAGTGTGVFAGVFTHDYEILRIRSGKTVTPYYATGNSASVAAGRIAYFLGLNGPAIAVDTACSSSLAAMHLACQALRARDCGLAIVCGVNLMLAPDLSDTFEAAGMLAPDGRCKTFDAFADGYVRSEGCAAIVLKPLGAAVAANDCILAIVRGTACNQDGRSNGLTAPSVAAQEAVIRKALEDARMDPCQVDAIECHGTGTSLGDPIEFRALRAVFGDDPHRELPLVLTSAKTAIGHLEAAAGLAGVIKVLLSFEHAAIPPHFSFHSPNPLIDLAALPAEIPVEFHAWHISAVRPRIAGVSSFGFSGTNVHVVLEEPPALPRAHSHRPVHLFALSAPTPRGLRELASRYTTFLAASQDHHLPDLAHTSLTGRAHFSHRLAFPAETIAEVLDSLAARHGEQAHTSPPRIAWLFTGQGAQYPQMARELYSTHAAFRAILDECSAILPDTPLMDVLWNSTGLIHETRFTQPALFSLGYALARTWQSWGIEPSILQGHSIGEYVAACVAGVFSLEDALRLVNARGLAMQSAPEGRMAAVFAGEAAVRAILNGIRAEVEIAAINAPEETVISGEPSAIERAAAALQSAGLGVHPLAVRRAFHSRLMDPVLDRFREAAAAVRYRAPNLPLISNVTGELAGPEVATPGYWVRHLRQPVRFHRGVEQILCSKVGALLEIGPSPTLLGLVRRSASGSGVKLLSSLDPRTGNWRTMMASLAQLYMLGFKIDFDEIERGTGHRPALLPTYPFDRRHYWLGSGSAPQAHGSDPILDLLSSGRFSDLERALAKVESLNEDEVGAMLATARGV